MNVLITNIGRRGYLVDFLKKTESFNGKIYVSDCDVTASGLYGNNDGRFILTKPVDNEKVYVSALLQICKEANIELIIPIIDPEIYILSKYVQIFQEEHICIAVSNRNVLNICYNKLEMNKFLKKEGFCFPKTYSVLEELKRDFKLERIRFPVILKPIYGSGSLETKKIDNLQQLETEFHQGMIIQEWLDGCEYGIDVFNSFEKVPLRCVIKKKIAMRSGETDKSVTVKNDLIQKVILNLANKLGHVANLDCDIIVKDEKVYIIDLNPRFGGGYPATHVSGVNLLELLLDMVQNKQIIPEFNNYQKNLLVMKEVAVRTTLLSD